MGTLPRLGRRRSQAHMQSATAGHTSTGRCVLQTGRGSASRMRSVAGSTGTDGVGGGSGGTGHQMEGGPREGFGSGTVKDACAAFLDEETRFRNLVLGTVQECETVFRSLTRWADRHGLSLLEELDEEAMRKWVGGWHYGLISTLLGLPRRRRSRPSPSSGGKLRARRWGSCGRRSMSRVRRCRGPAPAT